MLHHLDLNTTVLVAFGSFHLCQLLIIHFGQPIGA